MGDDLRTWMMRVFLGVLTLVAAGCMTTRTRGVVIPPTPPGTTAARVVRGHPTPPAEARRRQGALGRPAGLRTAAGAALTAAPPPPFPLAAGATGAGYIACPPAPGAAYTACYAWSYQPDADEQEPWQTAAVCLYKDSDPLVTVLMEYGGEYWYECPQFCGAHYAARCQAISTPGTGYNGTCHSSCAWVR